MLLDLIRAIDSHIKPSFGFRKLTKVARNQPTIHPCQRKLRYKNPEAR